MSPATAEKEKCKISRDDALAAMAFCGWGSANKWKNDKIAERLPGVKDVLPEQKPTDEKVAKALVNILAAIEAGQAFEVTGDDAAEKKTEKTEAEKKAEADKKEADKAAKEAAKAEEKAKKAKEKEDAKKAAEAAKANAPKNIRPVRSRIFLGAQVLKKHGLKVGITDEIVNEVDAMCENHNPKETRAWLTMAWHALNGYLGEFPPKEKVEKKDEAPATDAKAETEKKEEATTETK